MKNTLQTVAKYMFIFLAFVVIFLAAFWVEKTFSEEFFTILMQTSAIYSFIAILMYFLPWFFGRKKQRNDEVKKEEDTMDDNVFFEPVRNKESMRTTYLMKAKNALKNNDIKRAEELMAEVDLLSVGCKLSDEEIEAIKDIRERISKAKEG